MKIHYRTHRLRFLLLQISAASALLAASSVHAADGTWNVNASGTWGTSTNWLSDTIASGSGSTAYFTNDITADRTVTLDANRTLTNIVFGDSNTATAGSWIISNTATSLTLQGTTPTITVNALGTGKTATISSNIAGTAGLTKAGAGTLVFNKGTLSMFTGPLTINGGTFRLNNTQAQNNLYITSLNSVTTINNGSTLTFTKSGAEGRTRFAGGVTFGASGGNTLAIDTGAGTADSSLIQGSYTFTTLGGTTNYITTSANAFFNMQGTVGRYAIFDVADGPGATDLEVSMAVVDGGIRKNGAGLLTLTKDNTGINNLDITNGTLELAGNGRLNSGSFSVDLTNNGTLLYNGSNDQTLSGVISGSGSLTKSGNAALTLSGSNTYTGATTLNAGTLQLRNQAALQHSTLSLSGTGGVLFDSVVAGNAFTFGGLSSSNSAATLALQNSSVAAIGLTIGANNASTTYAGTLTGLGSLVKTGTGKVTLSGNNSYAGSTTVSNGILAVNGNQSSALGAFSVAAGASLMGSGTIGGATTIQGLHSPGNSPGIQTFGGDLTYSGGSSSVLWELAANTISNSPLAYDQIVVGGNLDFAGLTALSLSFNSAGSTVNWLDTFWESGRTWTLFSVSGTTTNVGNLVLAGSPSSWLDTQSTPQSLSAARPDASFSIVRDGNNVNIVYAIVPEPGALALAGVGIAFVCWTATRRRCRSAR